MIRAVTGEEVPDYGAGHGEPGFLNEPGPGAAGAGGMGMGGMNGFCWVARAVYGETDPRWLQFRSWLTAGAPRWLRELDAARGEAFAGWIKDKPLTKAVVKLLMDKAIATLP